MEIDKQALMFWIQNNCEYTKLCMQIDDRFSGWTSEDMEAVHQTNKIIDILEQLTELVDKYALTDSLSYREKLETLKFILEQAASFKIMKTTKDEIVISYVVSTIIQMKKRWFGK